MDHRQHGVREPLPLGEIVAAGELMPIGHDESSPASEDPEPLRDAARDLFELEAIARSPGRRAELRALQVAALERLRRLVPDDVNCVIRLGGLYALLGDHDAAVKAYKNALDLDPNNVIAWQGIAESYLSLGDAHEARRARIRLDRLGGPAIQ